MSSLPPLSALPGALLACLLGLPASASAAALEPQEGRAEPGAPAGRPRVGLVLSGGGARGAAHVGVIQVLEELHVPVDLVVGTSMGAIVGGLYASGYSPDEMERIIEEADWSSLFSDAPPRDELWFRRRQDTRRFQVDLEFGWKHGSPVLPPGLILGRNVEAFLERLTLPVVGVDDFDRLRVPYRCVATDLTDGSPVVFGAGSLPRAIRASMSLPGIFAPVEYEGRLLVDGGAVDNIPVDVARELGADVVIVVDISTPLGDLDSLGSPLGVSNQVVKILMANNRMRAMALLVDGDVAITPDLGDVTVLGFDQAVEAIELGREAARAQRNELAALAVDEDGWRSWVEGQRMPPFEPPIVRSLRIDRRTRLSERVVRRFAAIREGSPLDPEALEETRERLAGLGVFEGIEIDVAPVPGSPGEVDVVLRPIEKSWGPNYVRFGLGVSSDLSGEGEFDFGVQHTWTPLDPYGGEWRNEVQVGTRTRLFTEFYQPFDPGLRWFVAPSVTFEQDNIALRVDGDKIAEVGIEATLLALALGRNLGSWGEIRASAGWLTGSIRPEISLPGLLPTSTNVDSPVLGATLSLDTLDSVTFPEHGAVGELDWMLSELSVGNERTSVVRGSLGVPATSGALTLFTSLEGGSTVDGADPFGSQFELGGFRRLSGLAPGELSGNHLALAVLQPYWQLSERTTMFGMARYVGGSLEYGGVWQEFDELGSDDLLFGGSLYLGFDTLLGPAFVGVGLTEGGERSAYVFIGPVF